MTEAEWASCDDPNAMLEYLRAAGRASDRKLRLFACACCYRIRGLPVDPRGQMAVETAEQFADGRCGEAERRRASEAAWRAAVRRRGLKFDKRQHCDEARAWSLAEDAFAAALAVWGRVGTAFPDEREMIEQFFRDLFGNPFRPAPTVSPAWLGWNNSTIPRLAEAAYEERQLPAGTLDVVRLAVLADALEEADCHDAGLLEHLRSEGPHWRGCWAVDALLGKS